MKKILIIGSINMDIVIETERFPKIGETIKGFGMMNSCGGKGANQAVASARQGAKTLMIGAVGDDEYGKELKKNLENSGVDTSGIQTVNGSSGAAVITLYKGDNAIILNDGANAAVTPEFIKKNEHMIDDADIVVLQFEIPIDSVIFAAKLSHEKNKTVILNPAPMPKNMPREVLSYIDFLIPNRSETELLCGFEIKNIKDAERAVKGINNMGVKNVIITLGSDGCIYNDVEGIKTQSIYESKIVDTTGAGDSFVGAFAAKYEGDIGKACEYATRVSSVTVSRRGAQQSIPTAEEIAKMQWRKGK
ncbi:MAG: ribokinase [Firmicutes bacterium]|nr:ribokinase [Bacillota bacterium]